MTNVGDCPGNGACRQRRTIPNRDDRAHAEQAQTGVATACIPQWRLRHGNDGGLVVLFVFHRALQESSYFTLPNVQIVIGLLALSVAVVVAVPGLWDLRPTRLARPAKQLLSGPSLAVAGVAGLGIALPSVDYLAALAVILASGAAALTQVAVLLMFNLVAFALIEISLLTYLLAPKATVKWLESLNNWIRSRRRVEVAILLAAVGCVSLTAGVAS